MNQEEFENRVYAKKVYFKDEYLCVVLNDDRIISVPYKIFPRLANASQEDLNDFEIGHVGIHWEKLDEDISVRGLLSDKITIHPYSANYKPHSWKKQLKEFKAKEQRQKQSGKQPKQPEQRP